MQIKAAGLTNVGMKRNHNEDSYYILPEESLFIVADGMGGHSSGEVASQMAVETVANFFKATSNDDEVTWPFKMDRERDYHENRLVTGIKLANLRIFEAAQREGRYRGMGTTMVSAMYSEGTMVIGHVGDSRVYLMRGGRLSQITEDHSLLNDYIKAKRLTQEEIDNFPHKNVIVRALGMKETVQVDIYKVKPEKGDVILMCTDGLSGMVTDPELQDTLKRNESLQTAVEEMIVRANNAGGNDNITVVLARFEE
jgi:protein phosphatase